MKQEQSREEIVGREAIQAYADYLNTIKSYGGPVTDPGDVFIFFDRIVKKIEETAK